VGVAIENKFVNRKLEKGVEYAHDIGHEQDKNIK
jgi:hypothetical protein